MSPIEKLGAEHTKLSNEVTQIITKVQSLGTYWATMADLLQARIQVDRFIELVTLKLEELLLIRSEEMQTIEAMISRKFHHNMVNLDLLTKKFMEMTMDKENNYLDVAAPPHATFKIDHFSHTGKVYIKVIVPMADKHVGVMYKLYPVMQPVNAEWSRVIKLEADWMAVFVETKSYIGWKATQKSCENVKWREGHTISLCDLEGEVINGAGLDCVMKQIVTGTVIDATCSPKMVATPGAWFVRLSGANRWLYTVKTTTVVTPFCRLKNDIPSITINGSGIFQINDVCDINVNGTNIKFNKKTTTLMEHSPIIETMLLT